MGTVVAGGTYTLSADVTSNCQRDLAAWNIPASTPCQIAGIEIGIEGFQFSLLDVSWSKVTLATVIPPPPAPLTTGFSFSPTSPFPAQVVNFTASSSGGTPPYTQAWTFGDGSFGSGTAITHVYSVVGTFNVTLRTTDTSATVKTAVASHTVTIVAPPTPLTASFTLSPTSPIVGQAVSFVATVSGGTPPYSFSWAFGDGSVGSGPSVSHVYSSVGTFSVVLTVSDSGIPVQIVTVTHPVTVSPPPPGPLTLSFQGFDFDGRNEVTLRLNGVIIAKYWPTTNLTNAQVWVPISETVTLVAGINTIEFTHANRDCGVNDNIRNLMISIGTRALFKNLAEHILNCTTPATYSFTIVGMPPLSGLLILTPVSMIAGAGIHIYSL
jgi:PKD repeat protein